MSAKPRLSRTRLNVESLETRLTPTVSIGNGYLSFRPGTAAEYTAGYSVTVNVYNASYLQVIENGRVSYPARNAVRTIAYEGGSGNDTFINNTALTSNVQGFNGNDYLVGGSGADYINGGLGSDTVYGRESNDTIDLGHHADTLPNTAYGGTGDDIMTGGSGNDVMGGEAGNDQMNGLGGADLMGGGADNDTMYGSDGNDRLFGDTGRDVLVGGNNDDVLDGGVDGTYDYLDGGAGRDLIRRELYSYYGRTYNREYGPFDQSADRYYD